MAENKDDLRSRKLDAEASGKKHYRRIWVLFGIGCAGLIISKTLAPESWSFVPATLIGLGVLLFLCREERLYSKARDELVYLRGYSAGRQAR